MPKRDDAIIGAPCWTDLMTSDLQKAVAFYSGLFGWTAEDGGEDFGHYTTFRKDDALVAAAVPKMPGMENAPDAWNVYFGVDDAKATAGAASNAGGQVFFEPLDVMGMGTMAMFADPSGAAVGIWQPGTHRGFGLIAEASAPVWFELLTRDLPAVEGFYPQVFGVDVATEDTGADGPDYRTINVNGEPHAGLFDATGIMPDGVPAHWSIYFGVSDLEAAIRYVEEQGGSVLTPPMDSPYGRWSTVQDPMGAAFVLMGV